ncbi:MAG: succinate dehydrogenase cytochrome b subunit [Thermodesulfovibrionales bacterium]|nr:succinate dehydrogenase cytochrome b subunit [Thermodesulfovibrionales bacterium]
MSIKGFLSNLVGKKIVMAVTGMFLLFFVLVHLLGNSSIYLGPDGINNYTQKLQSMPLFVWLFRFFMITVFIIHVYFGFLLYLENKNAKPDKYAIKKSLRATFASKNMIWTGLVVFGFLLYHLLHFTFRVISIERLNLDFMQRPDVYSMVIQGMTEVPSIVLYFFGLLALMFHIFHGFQSLFQTLGVLSEKMHPGLINFSKLFAFFVFLSYSLIPAVIIAGILR